MVLPRIGELAPSNQWDDANKHAGKGDELLYLSATGVVIYNIALLDW